MEFNLNGLLISGSRSEDERIVELNTISVIDTVLSYGQPVRMFYSDVLLLLL
jgi:hypothetical protein